MTARKKSYLTTKAAKHLEINLRPMAIKKKVITIYLGSQRINKEMEHVSI